DALFAAPSGDDVLLDYRVLKAANEIRRAAPELRIPTERVEHNLDRDVRELLAAELHAPSQPDPQHDARRFLAPVRRQRPAPAFTDRAQPRALRAMCSAYPGSLSGTAGVRGSAEEFVASVISADHRPWILRLLPGAGAETRRALVETRYGLAPMTADESLAAL